MSNLHYRAEWCGCVSKEIKASVVITSAIGTKSAVKWLGTKLGTEPIVHMPIVPEWTNSHRECT